MCFLNVPGSIKENELLIPYFLVISSFRLGFLIRSKETENLSLFPFTVSASVSDVVKSLAVFFPCVSSSNNSFIDTETVSKEIITCFVVYV